MTSIKSSIKRVVTGAVSSTSAFPSAMLLAFLLMITALTEVVLGFEPKQYSRFTFETIKLALTSGILFGLATTAYAKSRSKGGAIWERVQLLGPFVSILVFVLIYFFGKGTINEYYGQMVSQLAVARVAAICVISAFAFLVFTAVPGERKDISASTFMVHKAFFIALLYFVIMGLGTSGIATAVQALIYRSMSHKVYKCIWIVAGFIAFSIFVGYFPDLNSGYDDEHRSVAERQPRFIQLLLSYVLIPIMLALSFVLLVWSAQVVFMNSEYSFDTLAAIAAWFTIGGVWLYIMITHHDTGSAKLYRLIYPIAALIILALEAWAFVQQVSKFGLKVTEYFYALLWILALGSLILLILRKSKSYILIYALASALTLVSVLPIINYRDTSARAQSKWLEDTLTREGILVDGELKPLTETPEKTVANSITRSVLFLSGTDSKYKPAWIDKDMENPEVFSTKLGFYPIRWYDPAEGKPETEYTQSFISLSSKTIDIRNYDYSIQSPLFSKELKDIIFVGTRGEYHFTLINNDNREIPSLIIERDGAVLTEISLKEYIDKLLIKYPLNSSGNAQADAETMSYTITTDDLNLLLVFNEINIYKKDHEQPMSYDIYINSIFIREK